MAKHKKKSHALRRRYGKRNLVRHVHVAADGTMSAKGKRITWGEIHPQATFTHKGGR